MNIPVLLPTLYGESLYSWLRRCSSVNLIPETIFSSRILDLPDAAFTSVRHYGVIPACPFYPMWPLLLDLENSQFSASKILMDHTIFKLLTLSYSSGAVALFIHDIFNTYPGRHFFNTRHCGNAHKCFCVCPECQNEKAGVFSPHSVFHQIPGVSVCWKHGCSLVKGHSLGNHPIPLNQSPTEMDQEFAIFCKDLLEGITFTTNTQVKKIIYEWVDQQKSILNQSFIPKRSYGELCAALSAQPLSRNMADLVSEQKTYQLFSYASLLGTKLALLFFLSKKDVGKVIRNLNLPIEMWDFPDQQYLLLEEYGWLIKVQCKKCGHKYYTTRLNLKNRIPCPHCSPVSDQEFVKLWIQGTSNNSLEVVSPFSGFDQPITIRNTINGKTKTYLRTRHIMLHCSPAGDNEYHLRKSGKQNQKPVMHK